MRRHTEENRRLAELERQQIVGLKYQYDELTNELQWLEQQLQQEEAEYVAKEKRLGEQIDTCRNLDIELYLRKDQEEQIKEVV